MSIREYDDGYDSAASFESAGADRPEDCEDPLDRWEDAVRYYGLDTSFRYSDDEKLAYISAYDRDIKRFPTDPLANYSHDEWLRIAQNMRSYGGSFAAKLGELMVIADSGNRRRIATAFGDLLDKYASDVWKL